MKNLLQVQYTAYGEVYLDSNPEFQLVVGFHGGLYDPLTKLVHFTQRDYDVLAGRWTSPDYSIWPKIGKDPAPFNLYMFKNNNPLSDMLDVKNYVTGWGLYSYLLISTAVLSAPPCCCTFKYFCINLPFISLSAAPGK